MQAGKEAGWVSGAGGSEMGEGAHSCERTHIYRPALAHATNLTTTQSVFAVDGDVRDVTMGSAVQAAGSDTISGAVAKRALRRAAWGSTPLAATARGRGADRVTIARPTERGPARQGPNPSQKRVDSPAQVDVAIAPVCRTPHQRR